MWPEAGHMALIMAAWVAVLQSVLPLWGSLSARCVGWHALDEAAKARMGAAVQR